GSTCVGDDTEVRREDAADLCRLDVDVNELPSPRIGFDGTCMAVCPPVADAHHKIGGEHRGVAIEVGGLQAAHACHQAVIVGDRTPAHQRWYDGNPGYLRKLDQQVRRIGIDDTAPGDN